MGVIFCVAISSKHGTPLACTALKVTLKREYILHISMRNGLIEIGNELECLRLLGEASMTFDL